jgi:hypothetical protein
MCALLVMSSEQTVGRLQAHADVKLPDTAHYQRDSRSPNARPGLRQSNRSRPQIGRTQSWSAMMLDPRAELVWIGEDDIGTVARFAGAGQRQGSRVRELSLDERYRNKRTP